jgi:protein-tyrosine kinase
VNIIEKAVHRLDRSKVAAISPLETATSAPGDDRLKGRQAKSDSPIPNRSMPELEINLTRLHQAGMVTPDQGRTLIAQEFRGIKRPLIKNAFNGAANASRHGNLIMVTSARPGEGKTFCSVNLAMSIAMERDHTVLLIDADMARPAVPRTLGLKLTSQIGLMDILLDDNLDLTDGLLKTNVDSLSILPAGNSHKHATELLASQAMSNLLDEIATRYPDRIVIFDSPPLLLTNEARVLASQMGQIVLVVAAEATTQNAVKDALRQIETNSNINLVYNKARAFADGDNYGYGYYD